MSDELGFEVRLSQPYEQALETVGAALKAEGFGILTRIDVRATLKEKIGAEFRPYTILGACNPPLAFRSLSADGTVGLLLPCNVTVEAAVDEDEYGGSLVTIVNPEMMIKTSGLQDNPVLVEVAQQAGAKLKRVVQSLAQV